MLRLSQRRPSAAIRTRRPREDKGNGAGEQTRASSNPPTSSNKRFTNPVLIDEEDGIIAGHGRVLGAHLLGLDEVPCIVLAHLTPTQRRAYVLADNKLALNAGWDLEMLSLEIGELGEAGFDLSLTGFDEFELGELFAERTQGRTDPDDAPEPPAHPVAEPGDLWVLGRHRLLCGDSTVATDVERVLGGVRRTLWSPTQARCKHRRGPLAHYIGH